MGNPQHPSSEYYAEQSTVEHLLQYVDLGLVGALLWSASHLGEVCATTVKLTVRGITWSAYTGRLL